MMGKVKDVTDYRPSIKGSGNALTYFQSMSVINIMKSKLEDDMEEAYLCKDTVPEKKIMLLK